MGSLQNISVLKGEFRPYSSKSLSRMFEDIARGPAENDLAIIYEDAKKQCIEKHSYAEVDQQSNQIARVLVDRVVGHGAAANTDGDFIVAVSMLPTDRLLISLLSIWKAGAAYLPLDPSFPENRTRHILEESRPALIIYDGEISPAFGNTDCISYDELTNLRKSYSNLALSFGEQLQDGVNDLAIVTYTSGSTGVPKGVRLPHGVILNRLQWQWRRFPYSPTETTSIFKTALTFVDSICEIWSPLLNGLTIVAVPKCITQDPERLVALLDKYKIERLVLVPSLLRSILLYLNLRKDNQHLKTLKIWVCSGEPLAVNLAEDFFKYFSKDDRVLCNFYGSTEVMADVTYYEIKSLAQLKGMEKVPIGVPVDNTIVYLLDSEFKPVPMGHVGELYVSGANLANGYVNGRDPDKFVENPLVVDPIYSRLYKTGDFARIERGSLQYEGRTDSQIKIRGHRVDMSEVEKAVQALPAVQKAVVLCYKPGDIDQALIAFVTTQDSTITGLHLEGMLQNSLTSYMIPQIIIIENIPLLVNGKTDRQTLLKMYNDTNNNDDVEIQLDIDYSGVPENKMLAAKILFETVGSVIGRSARATLSLKSNFYQLGGNSLNSIFTVTKLRDQGYVIGITEFLKAADMSEILDKMILETENMNEIDSSEVNYVIEPLRHEHKQDAIEMITSSFYEKADLEQWLMPAISKEDYSELMEQLWDALVAKDLSFVVCTETGERIAVALNFDARDEPEVIIHSKLNIVFEFLETIEAPIRDKELPPGKGAVLHSFMMATQARLTPQENVAVMQTMEEEVLKLARRKGFKGIFTTNTSPLTQQLGTDIYGYRVMMDYQVNEYVATDQSRPFGEAPDSQRAVVSWKEI